MEGLVWGDGEDGRGRGSDTILEVLYTAGESSDLSLEFLFGIRVGTRQRNAVQVDAVCRDTAPKVVVGRGILFGEV